MAKSLNVRLLNRLLRTELAAAAVYEKALTHVDDPADRKVLQENRTSHATRAVMLGQVIERQGGKPVHRAGPLSFIGKLLEAGASMLGRDALMRSLREAEALSLEAYLTNVKQLDAESAEEVSQYGLLEQQHALNRVAARSRARRRT